MSNAITGGDSTITHGSVKGSRGALQPPHRHLEGLVDRRGLPNDGGKLDIHLSANRLATKIMKIRHTRCTSVNTTACERGVGPFTGITTSGFERASSSRSCRGSCEPSTERYASSHSSDCPEAGGVARGSVCCWGRGGGAAGWDACGAAMLGPNHGPCAGCCCCCGGGCWKEVWGW